MFGSKKEQKKIVTNFSIINFLLCLMYYILQWLGSLILNYLALYNFLIVTSKKLFFKA